MPTFLCCPANYNKHVTMISEIEIEIEITKTNGSEFRNALFVVCPIKPSCVVLTVHPAVNALPSKFNLLR
jgi:hypothetical protein